jgi:hypothetical protein
MDIDSMFRGKWEERKEIRETQANKNQNKIFEKVEKRTKTKVL